MDKCPGCGEELPDVAYADNGGIIPDPRYVLVADWMFHTECWEEMVENHPPGDTDAQ